MDGELLPDVRGPLPGPRSRARVDLLARHECPAITARRSRRAESLGTPHDDPVVWAQAVGSNVWDVDGNRFVDFTSGFGVALVGHRHPRIVKAAKEQSSTLIHAMGDAWPDSTRIALLERLADIAPGGLGITILGLSGSDAIDAAVKTARLTTQRPGILVFEGGYHGLASGVLALQSARPQFATPFADTLHPSVYRLPWAGSISEVSTLLARETIGLVLIEPLQGRGGIKEPPSGWLAELAQVTRASGALFALDEILTGLGRTGTLFAGPAEGVVPDLLCVGKALAGGFPLSACIGTEEAMSGWTASTGEAIHTQTFLGHPVGCAAALAVLDLVDEGLVSQVQERAAALEQRLGPLQGRGLMRALPINQDALAVSRALLQRGFLTLPNDAQTLQIVPSMGITDGQLDSLASALAEVQ